MRRAGRILIAFVLLSAAPALAQDGKPRILVNFRASGGLLAEEPEIETSLEVVAEAMLAEFRSPVSGAALAEALEKSGHDRDALFLDPEARWEVAGDLDATGLSCWACSFGTRVVLVAEVIEPSRGLPGSVHMVFADGLEKLPEAVRQLLDEAGLLGEAPTNEQSVGAPKPGRMPANRIYLRMPTDDPLLFTYPNAAWNELVRYRDLGVRWVSEDEYRRLEAFLAEALRHRRRLETNAFYLDTWVHRTWLAKHPVLSESDLEAYYGPPYVVFAEAGEKGTGRERAKEVCGLLGKHYETFLQALGGPLNLPRLEKAERRDVRWLRVVVFSEEPGSTAHGSPRSLTTSWYSLSDRTLNLHLRGTKGLSEEHRRAVRFCATLQLYHSFAKLLGERDRGGEVLWSEAGAYDMPLWLTRGLAKYFAGEVFPAPNRDDLREWKLTKMRKLSEWSLDEILKMRTWSGLQRTAARKGLGHQTRLTSLFESQVSSLCHYLMSGEDGKYRPWLLNQLHRGLSGSDRDLLAGVEAPNWDTLAKHWEKFVKLQIAAIEDR